MPRRPRLLLPGVPIHIIQRGVDRSACFFTDADRRFYLEALTEYATLSQCAIHAYVLMANHVHLLLTATSEAGPPVLMKRLGQRYVRTVNRNYGRTGTMWEGRFRSCVAQDEGYVLACYRYIELNPVRARMVDHPRDYPWSSHRVNAEGVASPLITAHPQFLALGDDPATRRAAYAALVADLLDTDMIDAIRAATNGNHALGDQRFRSQIEAMLGRRAGPGQPGRPRRPMTTGPS